MSITAVGSYVSMPQSKSAPEPSASVAEQLAEVYALADELHAMTDRIRTRVESVISTLPPPSGAPAHDQPGEPRHDARG